MYRFFGVLLLIVDIAILPILLIYYMIYSMDLFYGCAISKGNFKGEFADFNKIIKDKITYRIHTHKERIFGA